MVNGAENYVLVAFPEHRLEGKSPGNTVAFSVPPRFYPDKLRRGFEIHELIVRRYREPPGHVFNYGIYIPRNIADQYRIPEIENPLLPIRVHRG